MKKSELLELNNARSKFIGAVRTANAYLEQYLDWVSHYGVTFAFWNEEEKELTKLWEQCRNAKCEYEEIWEKTLGKEIKESMIKKITEEIEAIAGCWCYTAEDLDEMSDIDPPCLSSGEYLRYVDDIVKTTSVSNVKVLEIKRLTQLEQRGIPAYFFYVRIQSDYQINEDEPETEENEYFVALDTDEDTFFDSPAYKRDINRLMIDDCWIGDIEVEFSENEIREAVKTGISILNNEGKNGTRKNNNG